MHSPITSRTNRALPGTRALRYFASVICLLALLEALSTRQPLIALLGLALGLGVVFVAHWFVESNQPRDVADFRPAAAGQALSARWLLLALGGVGLTLALIDLSDLTEEAEVLSYPIAQLGLPVLAFLAAVLVGIGAVQSSDASVDHQSGPDQIGPDQLDLRPISAQAESLWRAYLALVACGTVALGLAELTEHGVPAREELFVIVAIVSALALLGAAWRRRIGSALVAPMQRSRREGPQTLGVRVDGRVKWVDLLEDCMSFGQRRNILTATLAASQIGAGSNLLDIGCGTGELVIAAAGIIADGGRARGGHALGVDATPGMIEVARRRADLLGIVARFEVAVAEALPLPDGVIDGVTSSFFFHHLPSAVKREALAEMWRVLAPGGRLVITDYGRPQNLLGRLASFPMRFNYHEHVRGQLGGELEAIIAAAGIGTPRIERSFLGYINVMTLEKPAHAGCAEIAPSQD